MKQVRAVAMVAMGGVALVIVAAVVLRPLLPYVFALFLIGCILRIALRD